MQRMLDGEPPGPERTELAQHLSGCSACRDTHGAAWLLRDRLCYLKSPRPPVLMSERICTQVLKEYRIRQRRRRLVEVAALAACLVIAIGLLYWSTSGKVTESPNSHGSEVATSAPSLKSSLQEAGAAVFSLTRRTADETLQNTKLLLPAPDAERKRRAEDLAFEAPVQSLRLVEEGVAAGFEPVAMSARRAVNLIVREVSRPDERP